MRRANVQDSKRWKAWVGGKVEYVTAVSAISYNFYFKSSELLLDLSIKDNTHRKFTVNIYQHCDRVAKIHAYALGSTNDFRYKAPKPSNFLLPMPFWQRVTDWMHASFMKFTLSPKASVFLVEHVFHFRGEYTAKFT